MKEVIALLRPKKISATKEALAALGIPSITAEAVLGRGKQRGIASEVSFPIGTELLVKSRSGGMKFVPKRCLTIVVDDKIVDEVVKSVVEINQTAQVGDGKIFVCPVDDAVRVRTDEKGKAAVL